MALSVWTCLEGEAVHMASSVVGKRAEVHVSNGGKWFVEEGINISDLGAASDRVERLLAALRRGGDRSEADGHCHAKSDSPTSTVQPLKILSNHFARKCHEI